MAWFGYVLAETLLTMLRLGGSGAGSGVAMSLPPGLLRYVEMTDGGWIAVYVLALWLLWRAGRQQVERPLQKFEPGQPLPR